ncbi:rRNA-binding ribosome biosynthesis protein utp25 [Coemansia sp. RSA 552]|nr:rRNA-binding ribosome biosynthesis protein utp25 [Coemansia sp. RSA 552]
MPPARKKNGLSRKELQRLKEYGELDPLSSVDEDRNLDDLISGALSRSGYGSYTGKLGSRGSNREERSGSRKGALRAAPRGAKPDAYTKLLKSMSTMPKKPTRRAVSKALDSTNVHNDHSDDNMAADTADIDTDRASEGGSDDEEREIDEVDDEDAESDRDDVALEDEGATELLGDFMDAHFADNESALMHRKLAAVTNKEYEQSALVDDTLGPAVVCNVAGESVKLASPDLLQDRLAKSLIKADHIGDLSTLQRGLLGWLEQYHDVAYAGRTLDNEDEITAAYALHIMNHVMKAKDAERRNNSQLAKAHAAGTDAGELRDRGFTRPRVLVVLPFRHSAFRLVEKLHRLVSGDSGLDARFTKEYGPDDDEEERMHAANSRKPQDFQRTFAGSIDDAFRIGLRVFPKSLKLYADFYRADIIITSPIGLRMTTGPQGGDRRDFDFLSSIEMCIVDQCDVLLMQNWDHVSHLFDYLNKVPKKDHGCDFSRVRSWCLDGMAQYRRQTIAISAYMAPEIQAVFNNNCRSIEGKARFKPAYPGAVSEVISRVTQVFKRVPVKRLASESDDRFAQFADNVLPDLERTALRDKHTVIFVSSYFDFVRIRNHCQDRGCSFAAISEYSTKTEAMSARRRLFSGDLQFILYSERAHFYHRYPIKGIHHLVFYSLPDHAHYYSEMVNLMLTKNDEAASAENLSCLALYTKYDQLKLERIAGTRTVPQLLSGERSQFTFA